MIQIMLLSAFCLVLNQTQAWVLTVVYTLSNFIFLMVAGTPILEPRLLIMILLKSFFVYVFFRLLDWYEDKPAWWLIYFVGMVLLYLSDHYLGIPVIPGYSSIPFADDYSPIRHH